MEALQSKRSYLFISLKLHFNLFDVEAEVKDSGGKLPQKRWSNSLSSAHHPPNTSVRHFKKMRTWYPSSFLSHLLCRDKRHGKRMRVDYKPESVSEYNPRLTTGQRSTFPSGNTPCLVIQSMCLHIQNTQVIMPQMKTMTFTFSHSQPIMNVQGLYKCPFIELCRHFL